MRTFETEKADNRGQRLTHFSAREHDQNAHPVLRPADLRHPRQLKLLQPKVAADVLSGLFVAPPC
jgi:hypothetical protein